MQKKCLDNFITRNSLIPLAELESKPFRPKHFSYTQSKNYIELAELEPGDFYYNPSSTSLPYFYYRGSILLELSSITSNVAELKERISSIENNLNAAVAKRDFEKFLSIINPQLAPDLFMEIFDFVPDADKFPLFENLLTKNKYCTEAFSKEFIKKAGKYKGASSSLPMADEAGYVHVFVSQSGNALPPDGTQIWNTDINIAIMNALQIHPVGDIYQGQVHLNYIRNYVTDKLKNQVTVEPFKVEQIKLLALIEIIQFIPLMQTAGITEEYYLYVRQIKIEWFHNPRGIHALSHTKRVLLLVLLLAYLEHRSAKDTRLLCQAAIYHDIGRKTDGYDTEHGIASYQKMLRLDLLDPVHQDDTLKFIVENHAVSDKSALKKLDQYHLESIDETIQLYNIFKDADGLDRVRINDLNPEYLRTSSAINLLLAAHQLYQAGEFEQLEKVTSD